jgi:hypothetical protein
VSSIRYLWLRLRKQDGQINFWAIFGGGLLLVAYLAYPDPFHDFAHYLIKTVLDAAHDSFGGNGPQHGGAGHGGGGAGAQHSAPGNAPR